MNALRWSSIVLLAFNGVAACLGGLSFVHDPSGNDLQMPVSWLAHTPFTDYFIPGLILLVVIGCGSLAVAAVSFFRVTNYPFFVTIIGCTIVGWIVAQVLMLQVFNPLQLIIGGIGTILIVLGLVQWNGTKNSTGVV